MSFYDKLCKKQTLRSDLLQLMWVIDKGVGYEVFCRLSKRDIAEVLGTTYEKIHYLTEELKSLDYIRVEGGRIKPHLSWFQYKLKNKI